MFLLLVGVVIIDDHPEVTTTEDPQSSANDDGFTEVVSRKQQKRLQDEEKRKKEEQTTQVWRNTTKYVHIIKKEKLIHLILDRTRVKRALERRAEVVGENCHQGLQRSSRHRNNRPHRLSLFLVPHHRLSSSHPFLLPNIHTTLLLSLLQILRL